MVVVRHGRRTRLQSSRGFLTWSKRALYSAPICVLVVQDVLDDINPGPCEDVFRALFLVYLVHEAIREDEEPRKVLGALMKRVWEGEAVGNGVARKMNGVVGKGKGGRGVLDKCW